MLLLLLLHLCAAAGLSAGAFTKKPNYFCDPGNAGPKLHKNTTPAQCAAICSADPSCGAYSVTNAAVPSLVWCFTPATMCTTTCTVTGCTNFDTYIKDGWKPVPFNLSETLTSHMVLQQAPAKAAIWGWGTPGTKLTAALGPTHVGTAAVDSAGRWAISLPPQKPNAVPNNLTVRFYILIFTVFKNFLRLICDRFGPILPHRSLWLEPTAVRAAHSPISS